MVLLIVMGLKIGKWGWKNIGLRLRAKWKIGMGINRMISRREKVREDF